MPKKTPNYNLTKPLYSENADVSVLNENMDVLDAVLTPTVDASSAPGTASGGKLVSVLGWLANRIKAITGQASWQSTPSVSLEDCKAHIQNGSHRTATAQASGFMSISDKVKLDTATSLSTSDTLMKRDQNGRAKVAVPAESEDAANKAYVDTSFVRKNADTVMAAKLTAQTNTAYTTRQVRNIVFWTSGDTPPATANGDIVIKTF